MSIHLKINLMTWNVSGLNERPKRIAIRQTVLLERPDILGFQETKISQIDTATLCEICGRCLDQFVMLPSQGTRGVFLSLRTKVDIACYIQKHNGGPC